MLSAFGLRTGKYRATPAVTGDFSSLAQCNENIHTRCYCLKDKGLLRKPWVLKDVDEQIIMELHLKINIMDVEFKPPMTLKRIP